MSANKESIFEVPYNEGMVHQTLVAYMAGGRAGTKAQKTRGETRGGGAKPWAQKGTGRARAGSIRSPIWRGGGITFAAKPRSFTQKVNRKVYRRAMAMIVAELMRTDRLTVVDQLEVKTHKTKEFINLIAAYDTPKLLLVVPTVEENLARASGNVYRATVCASADLNPAILVDSNKVVITKEALKQLEERLT